MLPSDPKKSVSGSKGPAAVAEPGSRSNALATVPVVRVTPAEGPALLLPPALSAMPSATTLMYALRRRWFLALLAGLAGAALAVAGVWFFMPPKYTSVTLLRVSSRAPRGAIEGDTDFI